MIVIITAAIVCWSLEGIVNTICKNNKRQTELEMVSSNRYNEIGVLKHELRTLKQENKELLRQIQDMSFMIMAEKFEPRKNENDKNLDELLDLDK